MSFLMLLEANPVIQGAATAAATAAADLAEGTVPAGGGDLFSSFGIIVMYALIIGALYFFMFRPQRKRDKQMKQMQADIRLGDNVVTSSGFYGKVVDIGEDVFIIEFGSNRGIRVPVSKADIAGVKDPKTTPPPAKAIESK